MLPQEHHSLDDCCDLFVLSKFVPVVDEVEDSLVNVVVSLQPPVLALLHSVPGVVLTEERAGPLHIPGDRSLHQTPDRGTSPSRSVIIALFGPT